ncbi:RecQ family ATP-dependent DNA helicase [Belliella sp. DSM 111904]|uniref:DNA 3'-5' helicase n=1 Tax=Belliella filtrata TaxID=2923435 RepID=A0ABS9UUZ5_9BACT|nr:RecQ family ATP-dependent DNA helicase [Belliella filtrata]MCH7407899.1 RecQ family ATP-dependent DNA helicase [Belliella filtrata]
MRNIAFIDTEIEPKSGKILDIGCVKDDIAFFHRNALPDLIEFLKGTMFVCGHNFFRHDLKYLNNTLLKASIKQENIIDTLFLSPLLFPKNPYHALLKDDKLQTDELNNPLNDAQKTKDLFHDEIAAFAQLDDLLKQIFYLLLCDQVEFQGFFRFFSLKWENSDVESLIRRRFKGEFCMDADLGSMIINSPIELAYCLSLINAFLQDANIVSITPPWVLKNYPQVEQHLFRLRSKPCVSGCSYCDSVLDPQKGLKRFFGFDNYRTYGGEPLQEMAVKSAIDHKSILAIFPTGGGKSITFQVPALMSGEVSKALTIVISPLQSLMKDQVDNLEKLGITQAVTINGLLDPIERAQSFERVEKGSASILYISPESLRSKTIERLILGRIVARFVIDEAHCFSSWGQDFRVDYLYIGDFIKAIQDKKNLADGIPVSCFTATAKQKVIEDIRQYFKEKLDLDLEVFTSKVARTNLHYKVFQKVTEEEKYQALRDLIDDKNRPAIVYVSRTRKAYLLAERLSKDGFNARPYHGKMDKHEKSENQNAFINGDIQIMVATSAFGMGVDKKDVGMVVHYEISDSLENYVQEAGRAGRDERIEAECFVLFNEEDLSKHFILLNQTKLSIKEIQQVWKAIKDITKFRSSVSNSALEIARKAGWDDSVMEIETRVTTAIAALEEAGYLKRGQNMPRVFANSILSKNAQEAIEKINGSERFLGNQKEKATRIIKKLFSSKSRKQSNEEEPETRIDYISDHLGIVKEEVINIINLLREEEILADAKDLTAFIRRGDQKNKSLSVLETYCKIEKFLLPFLELQEKVFHIKALNESAEEYGIHDVSPNKIKTIVNFWAIKNAIKSKGLDSKNHVAICALFPQSVLKEKVERRHLLAKFIVDFLFEKSSFSVSNQEIDREQVLVEFSVHELKNAYDRSMDMFKVFISLDDVEDALFFLSRIEALKIEGGFLVVYNRLTIERTEQNNKKQYTKDDYQKLFQFYENKVQQIHIVGEYANRMIKDYKNALQFVEDYFQLNFYSFLNKYFKGSRQHEIKRNITPAKFKQLFGGLSPTQLKIINDKETKHIVVAAGPGSGKTRVLVHKLASLLLMEDVKHEQLLMITFSRAAASEFKRRLLKLIGNAANFIEIKTFHAYCFDLLGRVGSLDKSGDIIKRTIQKIRSSEVEASRITKTVLVIDEAQDMDPDEYDLVTALMEQNEEMRVIAVGDDDQNIFEFRGASSKNLENFIHINGAVKHELVENYRSKANIVDYTNQFVQGISQRLKSTPIIATQRENGKIKIVQHQEGCLISPLVQDIMETGLTGTTCVLTRTNDEALQVTGLLLKHDIQAKLIQSNEGFNLYNLYEVRFFLEQLHLNDELYIISDQVWLQAKRASVKRFRQSNKLDILGNIIKTFEASNPKIRYKSDLEVFIRESNLEDFYSENGEVIFVSTIHKSKGKEFDNVFLMLQNHNPATNEAKRLLYVAMTRAKNSLTIHTNTNFLENIATENLELVHYFEKHLPPKEITIHLSFKDIWLSYFIGRQDLIALLTSGEKLRIGKDGCMDHKGNSILKFSKRFSQKLVEMKSKGYDLRRAKVNFIVYWKNEEQNELKVILPELYFERV